MSFMPDINKTSEYSHGFSDEEVDRIMGEKQRLMKEKVGKGISLTLEEVKTIIVPSLRIARTTSFELLVKEDKPKKEPKTPKEKVEKVPKEKKMTKKQIQQKIQEIASKVFTTGITDEEQEFLNTYCSTSTKLK